MSQISKLIELVKCFFIALFFSREIDREEFGYYLCIPLPYRCDKLLIIVNSMLQKLGIKRFYGNVFNPNIIEVPPSKWQEGNKLYKAITHYNKLHEIWNIRKRNLMKK